MPNDDYTMLADYGREMEGRAIRSRQRRELPGAYGDFLSQLCSWDWFLTITFRDRRRDWEWRPRVQKNFWPAQRSRTSYHRVLSDTSSCVSAPTHDEALRELANYFQDVEREAQRPVGWILAEEFGTLGGRFHCHGLIEGVKHLNRSTWWSEAFRRFGRSQIHPFDPERYGAYYAAKYAAKQMGEINFGGTLAGKQLSDLEVSKSIGGKQTIVPSVNLERDYFHLGYTRRHR